MVFAPLRSSFAPEYSFGYSERSAALRPELLVPANSLALERVWPSSLSNWKPRPRCQAQPGWRQWCSLNLSSLRPSLSYLLALGHFWAAVFLLVITTGQQASRPWVVSSRSQAERCLIKVRRNSFIVFILASKSSIFVFNRSRTRRHSSAPPVVNRPLIS
jgi:hypothetical protein